MKLIDVTRYSFVIVKRMLLFILLLLFSAKAFPVPNIVLDDSTTSIDITTNVEILEDPDGNLQISNVLGLPHHLLFISNQSNGLLENSGSTYWIRFTLINSNNLEKWYLTTDNNYTEALQLYKILTNNLQTKDANSTPQKYEAIQALPSQHFPTFSLTLEKQTRGYLLSSDSI